VFANVSWLVASSFLTGLASWLSVLLMRNWKDPRRALETVDAYADQGLVNSENDLRRARVRCQFPALTVIWSIPLYMIPRVVDLLVNGGWQSARPDPLDRAPGPFEALAMALAIWGVLSAVLIIYLNRPRVLVPPYFRGEPGLAAARRLRARGEDVDAIYEASAERWIARLEGRGKRDSRG
jgi:hypothetical protein